MHVVNDNYCIRIATFSKNAFSLYLLDRSSKNKYSLENAMKILQQAIQTHFQSNFVPLTEHEVSVSARSSSMALV
jgi:hypothetical protein